MAGRCGPAVPDPGAVFENLAGLEHIALAVSGGSDSMALAVLARRWLQAGGTRPKISLLTVDHRLRDGARAEADQVMMWAKALGFDSQILCRQGARPQSGVQAKARQARYELLARWCVANHAACVVTAHTLDDQAETFMMRLARGSGVDGLSGMGLDTMVCGVRVHRPLLDATRQQLRAVLADAGQDWLEDPSNADCRYERVRVRRMLAQFAGEGIEAVAIARSAKRLARARQALDEAAQALAREAVQMYETGHAQVEMTAFEQAPDEVALRLVVMLAGALGGGGDWLKLSGAERVLDWLAEGRARRATFGGCTFMRRNLHFLVGREAGRIGQCVAAPGPGQTVLWDNRFAITARAGYAGADADAKPWIMALGQWGGGHRLVRDLSVPALVHNALPVIVSGDKLIAAPVLRAGNDSFKACLVALPAGLAARAGANEGSSKVP